MKFFKWFVDSIDPAHTTNGREAVIATGFCCLTRSYWYVLAPAEADGAEITTESVGILERDS